MLDIGVFVIRILHIFLCKQKTAYEWRISDWSSDVCSSDLGADRHDAELHPAPGSAEIPRRLHLHPGDPDPAVAAGGSDQGSRLGADRKSVVQGKRVAVRVALGGRRLIKKKRQCIFNYKKHYFLNSTSPN